MSNTIEGTITANANITGDFSTACTIEGSLASGIRYINMGYNKQTIDNKLADKQDKLSTAQLANINADHSRYLTAHQSLSAYALKSELPTVPANVSAFTNDAGYLTQHQSLTAYALKSELPNITGLQEKLTAGSNITITGNVISAAAGGSAYDDTEIRQLISTKASSASLASVATSGNYNDLSNKPTQVTAFTNDAGYLTEHQSLENYATKQWVEGKNYLTSHQDISGKANTADLATVATSGSYNDLSNKPTIPAAVTDAHINDLIDAKLGVIENGSY